MPDQQQLATTAYLILRPTYSRYDDDTIVGFTVDAVRKTRPRGDAAAGSVVVAVRLALPAQAFEPLRAAVDISVPEGAYDVVPEVTVESPEPVAAGA